ncbi:hypothetical protein [Clostridium baratii]|uniref:hypothetical protein n=1 Tax=Clostridium baratii TaxID=1561 RepID=UPI001C2353D1|nr:hypothetical protein [Clostridium baratii]
MTSNSIPLIDKVMNSISELNLKTIYFRSMAHDKIFIENANKLAGSITAISLNDHIYSIISKINHLLDDEKGNVSLKNLIKDKEDLINRFNCKFCSNEINNNSSKFKYKYKEEILKIKKFRNKKIGHQDVKFKLTQENTFLYRDIYNLVEDITEFFIEIYPYLKTDTEINFEVFIESEKKKVEIEKSNIIKATELFEEYKVKEQQEFRKNLRSLFNK